MEPEIEPTAETRILEINLISAQSLKIPRSIKPHRMHTYTIAWVDPSFKLRSHLDRVGGPDPTWNEKFIFRVSPAFIYGDTSAVQFQIYACGFITDYLIGNVRFLLSSSSLNSSKTGAVVGTPAFSALHIRRPSGRIHGVLNIAATVYECSDFAAFNGMSAVCFHDWVGDKVNGVDYGRRERRFSWHPNLSRVSSKKSETTESGDCLIGDSVGFSDETESTASCSSSAMTADVVTEVNGVKSADELAGKKVVKSDGRGLLCGLMLQRRFSFSPSDRNLLTLPGFHKRKDLK